MTRLSNQTRVADLSPRLPQPFRTLESAGICLREGQMSLVIAAPGVGKTLFAHNYAVRSRCPSLYFSADSDQFTVYLRTAAILSGTELNVVEQQLQNEQWAAYYRQLVGGADHIEWVFDPHITVRSVVNHTKAYREKVGEDPALIVVDNLSNAVEDMSDQYTEMQALCRDFHRGARDTRAHLMVLTHVTGNYEDGDKAIPLSGALGKVGKYPEQVFSLHRADEQTLGFTVPKNRGGKSHGSTYLLVDYERATIQ